MFLIISTNLRTLLGFVFLLLFFFCLTFSFRTSTIKHLNYRLLHNMRKSCELPTLELAMYMPVVLRRCFTCCTLYTCRTSLPPNCNRQQCMWCMWSVLKCIQVSTRQNIYWNFHDHQAHYLSLPKILACTHTNTLKVYIFSVNLIQSELL